MGWGGIFLPMADNKKSVLLYCDIIHTVKELSNEEAGILFKHYLSYINDLNPTPPDKLTQIVFEPIKQNLKRDLKKWESKSLKNSTNAKLRWDANASERIKTDANHADKVTVKDTVTDTVNDKVIVKENIDSRKLKFASTLEPFVEIYGKDLLNDFYKYWTEPNKSKTKFRQELEKTWDLERRLGTWAKNDKNFNKGKKDFTTHITTVLQQRDIDFKQFEQQHGNNEDTKRLD